MRKLPLAILCFGLLALVPATALAADWPTYHGDNTRQGNDTTSPGLATPVAAWTSVALDGKIYGQPVVAGSQVIVATENNTVYSLNAADGSIQWSNHLATPRTSSFLCGNINPLGITGTPVIDAGAVWVVANVQINSTTFDFQLASLNLATGTTNWMRSIAPPDPNWASYAQYEQQRGALMAINGRIVVPLGGLFGDCGSYHGFVLSYAENNTGVVSYWKSADVIAGNNGAGMWAAGGLSADVNGFVYGATGNSNHTTSTSVYDYSDSVIKLNPAALAPGAPVDYFAPGNWYADNAIDADLGGMGPLQLPNNRVMIVGKSGMGYLLDTTSLGHIGGQLAVNRVCSATNNAAYGSMAYANGVVYVGCSDGLTALQINNTSTNFSALWHNTANPVDHPPTVAGGLVWSISGGTLVAFNPANGAAVTSFAIGGSTRFTTPTAANNQLYVSGAGAQNTQVYAFKGAGGVSGCTVQPGPRLIADFSGDGKADLAAVGSTGTCVLLSTGTAFANPAQWASVPFYGNRSTLAGDVAGTGKAALVALNNTSTWVMTSTGTGFTAPAQWSNIAFYGTRGTFLADVNGDGKADLVAINDTSVWVMLSTGTGFGPPTQWSNTAFYGNVTTTVGDVNGDRRADLIAVNNGSTWVMTSTGTGFNAPAMWNNQPFYGNLLTTVADVNGDGRADLVAVNSGSVWVMTSTGTGFGPPTQWSGTAFYGQQTTAAADVNGDLKADLVAVNNVGVWVVISSGTGYSAPSMWYAGPA